MQVCLMNLCLISRHLTLEVQFKPAIRFNMFRTEFLELLGSTPSVAEDSMTKFMMSSQSKCKPWFASLKHCGGSGVAVLQHTIVKSRPAGQTLSSTSAQMASAPLACSFLLYVGSYGSHSKTIQERCFCFLWHLPSSQKKHV